MFACHATNDRFAKRENAIQIRVNSNFMHGAPIIILISQRLMASFDLNRFSDVDPAESNKHDSVMWCVRV